MKRADDIAREAFGPYYKMGGVLRFNVYEGASNDDAHARSAIRDTLVQEGKVNDRALNALQPRRLNEAQFFGDWYNPSDGSLVWNGSVTLADGRQLTRPTFRALAGVETTSHSSSASVPDVDQDGQFAYAFANPPYPLKGPSDQIQQVFDDVRRTLLPPGDACVITDWTSSDLDEVSDYFAAGKEWWGMFLFTIRDTTTGRMTVIIGSATD
jgi:hypothetical protein